MQTVQLVKQYLQQVRQALMRHWRKSVALFAAILLLTTGATFLLPRAYYSEAKLFVRFGRTAVMDPTATAGSGQVVSLYDTRESELNSLLEVLRNRTLLERVVDQLGAENILRGRVSDTPTPFPERRQAGKYDEPGPMADSATRDPTYQQAIAKLEKCVSIAVPRKTSTIVIGCKAERPELAQRVVATLVTLYLDEHLRVHHTAGSYEFFKEQTELLEKRWREAVGKVQQAKDQWQILTFEGKRKNCENAIADIEMKRLSASSELASAEAKIQSLASVISGLPQNIPTLSVDSPNAAVDGMRQELYKIQGREQELVAKFSDKHPQVLALRSALKDLQQILADQEQTRSSETTAVNPSRQSLELALHNERATAESLRGRIEKMTSQLTDLQGELHVLNSRESQLAALARDVELSESRYRAYTEKLEQARINQRLDEERISNISVVQPASFVNKPSGPRKVYVLALGFVVALLGGLGIAVVAQLMDPMLKRLEDIEVQLRLPVVGAIPVAAA